MQYLIFDLQSLVVSLGLKSTVTSIAVGSAACGGGETVESTLPAPATEAEMEVFCARYEEVKNQSDKWLELEKVAPVEIKGQLFRLANGPSEN